MRIIPLLLACLLLFLFPATGVSAQDVSGYNAVLIDQEDGKILFEKRAHEKQSVASITKVMTAIIAIESGKMKEVSKTSRKAIYTEGSSIYLEQGEKMTIEDLVYGLMLRSGNDSAVAIAEHIGGSEDGFVHLMNEKAAWIGMQNTHFDNPHGLESETHYSTAYDMALLMRYAMENEYFQKISGTKMHKADGRTYSWKNKNRLLTEKYEHCTGGKTGFTKKAGRTLVTTAEKNGRGLVAVTLNAPDDWNDHIQLYEYGFDQLSATAFEPVGQQGSFFTEAKNIFLRILKVRTE